MIFNNINEFKKYYRASANSNEEFITEEFVDAIYNSKVYSQIKKHLLNRLFDDLDCIAGTICFAVNQKEKFSVMPPSRSLSSRIAPDPDSLYKWKELVELGIKITAKLLKLSGYYIWCFEHIKQHAILAFKYGLLLKNLKTENYAEDYKTFMNAFDKFESVRFRSLEFKFTIDDAVFIEKLFWITSELKEEINKSNNGNLND